MSAEYVPLAGDSMKAISLWQPWASLVALGVKTIETRSWSTKYRGPLAIHAAKRPADQSNLRLWMPLHSAMKRQSPCGKCDHPDSWHACHMTFTRCALCGCDGWTEPPPPLGAVVATCTLVDVLPMVTVVEAEHHAGPLLEVADRYLSLWLGGDHVASRIDDQRPYGDFSPGRYAWLLADIKPVDPPIPARGRQQLWNWTPSAAPHLDGGGGS